MKSEPYEAKDMAMRYGGGWEFVREGMNVETTVVCRVSEYVSTSWTLLHR